MYLPSGSAESWKTRQDPAPGPLRVVPREEAHCFAPSASPTGSSKRSNHWTVDWAVWTALWFCLEGHVQTQWLCRALLQEAQELPLESEIAADTTGQDTEAPEAAAAEPAAAKEDPAAEEKAAKKEGHEEL
jgi:hypothetical protein